MTKNITVIMGGYSAEREISLSSGTEVVKVLNSLGYSIKSIDVNRNIETLLSQLKPKPDIIFNALHGQFGEDGRIQGILDILAIPYTHSGVLPSALAMDKVMAKKIFKLAGIKTPEHRVVGSEEFIKKGLLSVPYVLKPVNEGSSVGVYIVRERDSAPFQKEDLMQANKNMMIEKFIEGQELTVAVMGGRPLAVTEIITNQNFYDYEAKYSRGGSDHIIPANISDVVYQQALSIAKKAYEAIGCRGLGRVDFRFDGEDLFILELNTQPGLTPTSLVPEQAIYTGISFEELVVWMVENAECGS